MEVYQIIKQLRLKNGHSQSFVAQRLGITQSSYAKIEGQKVDLNLSRLQSIADLYSITIIELLSYNIKSDESKELGLNKIEGLYKVIIKKNEDLIIELKEQVNLYKSMYYDLKK